MTTSFLKGFAVFAVALLALVQQADASSIFYSEILTSGEDADGGTRSQITAEVDFNPFSITIDSYQEPGGLGSAYMDSSDPLLATKDYTHEISPAFDVDDIERAWLYVAVVDDLDSFQDLSEAEIAVVEIFGGAASWTGNAFANAIGGDISSYLDVTTQDMDVTLRVLEGDFYVLASALKIQFTPGAGGGSGSNSPMPEPSAAVLFGAGVLIVARRRRHLAL